MKKYLVLAMSKTSKELHRAYVENAEPHGTRIEEYVDGIISQVGCVWWATFPPDVPEEKAERAFADYTDYRRSCEC